MEKKIIIQIDKLVEIIYSPDQYGFNQEFIELLDLIDSVIKNKDEDAVLMTVLSDLQLAYERKDYVDIADILLHQLQIYFESL